MMQGKGKGEHPSLFCLLTYQGVSCSLNEHRSSTDTQLSLPPSPSAGPGVGKLQVQSPQCRAASGPCYYRHGGRGANTHGRDLHSLIPPQKLPQLSGGSALPSLCSLVPLLHLLAWCRLSQEMCHAMPCIFCLTVLEIKPVLQQCPCVRVQNTRFGWTLWRCTGDSRVESHMQPRGCFDLTLFLPP